MSFYSEEELRSLGLGGAGKSVRLSSKASIYNAASIRLGDNVRIDDFCVLSAGEGGIEVNKHVHIAAFSSLIGRGRITLGDYSNISSRVSIYSSSDDYSGEWMTNPTLPSEFTGVTHADVHIGRHAIVGAGSVILPGLVIADGCAIGALSLVNKDCDPFGVYAGVPARRIGERKRCLLELERMFDGRSGDL